MTALFAQPVFQLYAICSAVLVVVLYGLGFYTAKIRADGKKVINAEDVSVNRGSVAVDVETPEVQRIKRAHLNLLENAVPFFVLGFLYSLTSPSLHVAQAVFLTFVGFRVFHAIFYLTAKQPFRTLSFAFGGLLNLFLAVQVIRAAI